MATGSSHAGQIHRAYPTAKATALGTELIAEVAVVAEGALVDRAVSRSVSWDQW